MCPFSCCAVVQLSKNFKKQDQIGILAQIFLLCGNLRLGIFPRTPYSALVFLPLSSAAMVTAAQTVQQRWLLQQTGTPVPHSHVCASASEFGTSAVRDLYSEFALRALHESGAARFHAQAYIPTQPAQAIQEARISHAHEDPGRPEGSIPPPRQGAQAGLGETRFPRVVQCGPGTLVRAPACGTSDLEV